MDHVSRLMSLYCELVTDPTWLREQERREAVKLERFVRRLMGWDGVSEELPPCFTKTKHSVHLSSVGCR